MSLSSTRFGSNPDDQQRDKSCRLILMQKLMTFQALLGLCALVDAGLFLRNIQLEDISISAYNSQVKLGE
jgi:hypothetical protein